MEAFERCCPFSAVHGHSISCATSPPPWRGRSTSGSDGDPGTVTRGSDGRTNSGGRGLGAQRPGRPAPGRCGTRPTRSARIRGDQGENGPNGGSENRSKPPPSCEGEPTDRSRRPPFAFGRRTGRPGTRSVVGDPHCRFDDDRAGERVGDEALTMRDIAQVQDLRGVGAGRDPDTRRTRPPPAPGAAQDSGSPRRRGTRHRSST